MTKRPLKVDDALDEALQEAHSKFGVPYCEIFRRAWRSYQKGNVEIRGIRKSPTPRNSQVYSHDLPPEAKSAIVRKVLRVYLAKYKNHAPAPVFVPPEGVKYKVKA